MNYKKSLKNLYKIWDFGLVEMHQPSESQETDAVIVAIVKLESR